MTEIFHGRLELNIGESMEHHGLGPFGAVQKTIDANTIALMSPFTPFRTGILDRQADISTVIGSGEIQQSTPYARFQYYGKVMVDPDTGSTWAPKYGTKVVTDRNLVHSTAGHALAGPFWFERMKEMYKEQLLALAMKAAQTGEVQK